MEKINEKMKECCEYSDTIDEAVENSESHIKECKTSPLHDPGTLDIPINTMEDSQRIAETSPIEESELLNLNPKKNYSITCKVNKLLGYDYLDYCTRKIQRLKIEPEDNMKESIFPNFWGSHRPQLTDFLSRIFQWNPTWLDDAEDYNIYPPVVDKKSLTAILPSYISCEQYYKIIEPLVALEMWHSILEDYKVVKGHLKTFLAIRHSISRIHCSNKTNVSRLTLKMLVSKVDFLLEAYPSNGDLFRFNYLSSTRGQQGSLRCTGFMYVTEISKALITPDTCLSSRLLDFVKQPYAAITITAMTLDVTNELEQSVLKLHKITYIRSNIRMVQALQQLHRSPLMNMILHPKIEDYQLLPAGNIEEHRLVTKHLLNPKQLESVMRITKTVAQMEPKICLIHGPPGTGKSKVIVNLIMQILPSKLKILVCAPSNTAIDEIVLRLLEIKESCEYVNHFSLVRIGRIDAMHPKAQKVSLQSTLARLREKKVYGAAGRVLNGADVIASTLNSSYTSQMESVFDQGRNSTRFVCIIDEATQCNEPESLIPLMLNVKTLVLVGDPKQLPATVLSQKAKQLGFDQSLFARIGHLFEGKPNNPIIQLDVQYRMTGPVAQFPNKFFYDGRIKNAAKVNNLPFYRYRVINLDSTQDRVKFSNSDEANFVANLIYTIIDRTNCDDDILPVKVGIITPYNDQKKMLTKKINNCIREMENKNKVDFEVNTVDSFQGQERDVIIMSCVRSNGIGFLSDRQRLCVALTRAKHSLIICGNFKTFRKDAMWNALLTDAESRGVYVNVKSNASPRDIRPHIIC